MGTFGDIKLDEDRRFYTNHDVEKAERVEKKRVATKALRVADFIAS